jgi:hypothetical protein
MQTIIFSTGSTKSISIAWKGKQEDEMTGKEVLNQIATNRNPEHSFIKWWRKSDDFIDFELIDIFKNKISPDETLDGFELLDIENMWNIFINLNPDNLRREKNQDGEFIQWLWSDKNGNEMRSNYPFTPQGLKTLIDADLFD